jgi:hypothetical protein
VLTKWSESFVAIAGGLFGEFVIYQFWPTWLGMWGVGMAQISNTPGHAMIRAFATWLPLPILILIIPGITIASIVWIWKQP